MANITLLGASYTDVPAVDLPKTGGGTVRFYENGGTPSQTQHTILFEFTDETSSSISAYWDGTFISDAIRATIPTTYNNKTVTLAQLDGVTWYEPAAIPLNTQLIDFSKVQQGYIVNGDDGSAYAYEYGVICDYTQIDPSMTFSYVGYRWWNLAYYDASKVFIESVYMDSDADSKDEYDSAHGTLTPSKIPSNAVYVRISAMINYDYYDGLSLIRTA